MAAVLLLLRCDTHRSKAVILPSHQVKTISFMIKAKKLGRIAIRIEAVNNLASDGLEHFLQVTPESRRYEINEAKLIELSNSHQSFNITCNIPRGTDPGSIKITAQIDHAIIGLPTKHAESLINIPKGCSDLNLLTFVPNIVALDLISLPDSKADETIKQKAIDSMKKGYDNQLRYKSSNGAFKQWTSATSEESIFLTALVSNVLITASKYINVDRAVIKDAFSWLAGKQKTDGCFDEVGEVVYSPIQDSSFTLTAFIVVAIQENQNFSIEYKPHVDKAIKCVADNFENLSSTYQKALATYALSMANHPKRSYYLDELIKYSINSGKNRFWDENVFSIQIAAYALLSYIAQDLSMQALDIFHWLNEQRLATGGFEGVQNTFVGLKSIGKMALIVAHTPVDYRVQIKSKLNNEQQQTWHFHIDQKKSLGITDLDLPDTYRVFNIEFSGTGYGFFQLSYQYHFNIEVTRPSFDLKLALMETSNYQVQDLKVCLRYISSNSEYSNKVLVEVYLPSGLVVNDNSVRDLSDDKNIKNTMRAFDGTAMFVYYNTIGPFENCFVVTAHRKFKIAMHKPAYVVVYDTEDRNRLAVATYEGVVLQVCDICENEDCKTLKC